MDTDIPNTVSEWATKAHEIIADPVSAFALADKLQQALIPQLSWSTAAAKLTTDIESVLAQ
jgi:hypothetical protein